MNNTIEPNIDGGSQETGDVPTVEVEGVDPDTGGYTLASRTNMGVPPKRYTPERIKRKARYSVANLVKGHLTEMVQAFEEALYDEEETPHSADEAT